MKSNSLKLILTALFYTIYIGTSMAQDSIPSLSAKPSKPDNFWHRVTVGGNLGLQFGSVTGISVAPEADLKTIDQLHVGLRFIYQYYNYKNYFWDNVKQGYIGYETNVYGGGIYLRYYLSSLFDSFLGNLFAHAEYEYLYYSRPYKNAMGGHIFDPYGNPFVPGKEVVEINSIFVGGGYRQPISNRVSMDFLILFNLNESNNSPYSNPIFRLGVGVGL
ncbi:MAG: hypothetical protein ACOYNC_19500 [Bacteroidales bacterium]